MKHGVLHPLSLIDCVNPFVSMAAKLDGEESNKTNCEDIPIICSEALESMTHDDL